MKWIKVSDELPVIPEGRYAVTVLVALFDPCYDEINPGRGYSVTNSSYRLNEWGVFDFHELLDNGEWCLSSDTITHWMYLPEPPVYDPEVLNPIFQWYHDNALPQSPLKQI